MRRRREPEHAVKLGVFGHLRQGDLHLLDDLRRRCRTPPPSRGTAPRAPRRSAASRAGGRSRAGSGTARGTARTARPPPASAAASPGWRGPARRNADGDEHPPLRAQDEDDPDHGGGEAGGEGGPRDPPAAALLHEAAARARDASTPGASPRCRRRNGPGAPRPASSCSMRHRRPSPRGLEEQRDERLRQLVDPVELAPIEGEHERRLAARRSAAPGVSRADARRPPPARCAAPPSRPGRAAWR